MDPALGRERVSFLNAAADSEKQSVNTFVPERLRDGTGRTVPSERVSTFLSAPVAIANLSGAQGGHSRNNSAKSLS